MIKLENIHTDAELLGVFKRLAHKFTLKIEDFGGLILPNVDLEKVEEKVIKEFLEQENVLELPQEVSLQANDNEAMNKNLYGLKGLSFLV